MERRIRLLIVDDSIFFRNAMKMHLERHPMIEVVGMASNVYEARDQIIALRPQVMTLDIEMPKMDGISFLKRLIPQVPIPTVVVSGAGNRVFDAMANGAVDFVEKMTQSDVESQQRFFSELAEKIVIAASARPMITRKQEPPRKSASSRVTKKRKSLDLIAIGASTGGTEAVFELLKGLAADKPPIVIVQHMPPVFTRLYAERLDQTTSFSVKEAADGDRLENGGVYIAPGGLQMRVRRTPDGFKLSVAEGDKVNGHCPSVDVLFRSVAEATNRSVGIILTGMGFDGAKGLLAMRRRGAMTFGQDEKTSVVYGMPRVAYSIGAVVEELPLQRISARLERALEE